MAAAATSTDYVWIKLATAKEDTFAKVYCSPDKDFSDVAAVACSTLGWGLPQNKVRLFMLAKPGPKPQLPAPEAFKDLVPLAEEATLVGAGVTSGAWLVAVPTAPGSPGGGGGGADSILSQLLGLQVAESEQRRLASTLRSVQVQRWDAPISSMIKLSTTFAQFYVEALAAVKVTGAARLYMIRDEKWGQRLPLTLDSYAAFLTQSQDMRWTLPDIHVFEQMPGAQTSPLVPPAGLAQGAAVEEGGGHDGASHSRSTAMQTDFRNAVSLRDGLLCVQCRGEPPLQAAHIIARIAEQPELLSAGLLNANVPNNGIMLCTDCHLLHDAFLWCFDPSKGVVVADALLHDADLGAAWALRVGTQLSQPSAADLVKATWWPPASVWAAGVARFEAARLERHAEADRRPFSCGKCRKRFKLARGLTGHRCGQVQHQLFTPESVRSASSGARAGGGAEAGVV